MLDCYEKYAIRVRIFYFHGKCRTVYQFRRISNEHNDWHSELSIVVLGSSNAIARVGLFTLGILAMIYFCITLISLLIQGWAMRVIFAQTYVLLHNRKA